MVNRSAGLASVPKGFIYAIVTENVVGLKGMQRGEISVDVLGSLQLFAFINKRCIHKGAGYVCLN